MSLKLTLKELRKMNSEDLLREIKAKRALTAGMRLAIKVGKEKDSARFLREKKELSRMLTVLNESKEEATLSSPS